MKRNIFFALGALAMMASCSDDIEDSPKLPSGNLRVICNYPQSGSRATDTNWEDGDRIGISGNGSFNVVYDFMGGSAFGSANGLRIDKDDTSVFTAYYPYNENLGEDKVIHFDISDQKNSDFMWAQTNAGQGTAVFTFTHRMSKLSVKLIDKDNQYTDTENLKITVRLTNQVIDGDFNTATGIVTPGTTKGSIEKVMDNFDTTASFIIPSYPEGKTAEKILIEIEVEGNGVSDLYRVYEPVTPRSGKHYPDILSLTKNTTGATGSIEDWKKEEGEFQWW